MNEENKNIEEEKIEELKTPEDYEKIIKEKDEEIKQLKEKLYPSESGNISWFSLLLATIMVIILGFFAINSLENKIKGNKFHRVEKPVIYLYPTQEENVQVSLDTDDVSLTTIYPKFSNNQTWNILANPNGELLDTSNNKKYSYLYYEGKGDISYDLSKGFIVKGEESADFLEENLSIMGLNYKERNDFITYWLPKLEGNKYNLIHFSENEYEKEVGLEVSPKEDKMIRIYMVFKGLDEPVEIKEQTLPQVNRENYNNQFTVVEWGGSELE